MEEFAEIPDSVPPKRANVFGESERIGSEESAVPNRNRKERAEGAITIWVLS